MKKEFNKEEYNKLCAEFLGYVNTTPTDKDFNIHEHPITKKMIETNFDKRFLQDWNWIMEVWKVIKSTKEIKPIGDTTQRTLREVIRYAVGNVDKEEAVKTIWNFLNWYNEQKQ